MLIPYGTDAPTYHIPFATVAIIVINTVMFLATGMGEYHNYRWLILEFDRINPLQWVTAAFMHASWMHLISNMIFLWCFGLVVEGKIGWKKFSWLYVGLALADGAIGQIPMFLLSAENGALGASGVIFALIAVALVWAPQNDMHCVFVWSFLFVRTVDIPIYALGLFYFAVECLGLAFNGFHMSSAMLHLLGMSIGFPFAIYMLRKGLVDCEGWDLLSRTQPITDGQRSFNPLFLIGSMFGGTPARDRALFATSMGGDSGRDALKQIRANPAAFNPTPNQVQQPSPLPIATTTAAPAPLDGSLEPTSTPPSKEALIRAMKRAIQKKEIETAGQLYGEIKELFGTVVLGDSLIANYANLLSIQSRHSDSLEPLLTLISRRSKYNNQACIRVATIQIRLQNSPETAVWTLTQMTKPWSNEIERKRVKLLREADSSSA
ncbi:MAG: rhomboid family intramembrane serine protease [Rubripirellula sp.]